MLTEAIKAAKAAFATVIRPLKLFIQRVKDIFKPVVVQAAGRSKKARAYINPLPMFFRSGNRGKRRYRMIQRARLLIFGRAM